MGSINLDNLTFENSPTVILVNFAQNLSMSDLDQGLSDGQ